MIKILTKEHMVYFMQCGIMKLSSYDLHFVQNLHHIINNRNPITSNQELLLDKLVEKYKRQFNKSKMSLTYLKNLKWEHTIIVKSASEFTDAFIEIVDGKIYLRCPFSKKFLTDLRSLDWNPFTWDRDEKRYFADAGTYAFKILHSLVHKNYNKVNYCPVSTQLINTALAYDSQMIWDPTLVKVNESLIICATNEFVQDAIKDIEFNLDIKTISKLAEHGIKIAGNLSTDEKLNFAGKYFYETSLTELQTNIIDWLKELECDCIFFSGISNYNSRQDIFNRLNNLGIHYYNHSDVLFTNNQVVMSQYKYIASINFTTVKTRASLFNKYPLRKIIKVNNSYPIELNERM